MLFTVGVYIMMGMVLLLITSILGIKKTRKSNPIPFVALVFLIVGAIASFLSILGSIYIWQAVELLRLQGVEWSSIENMTKGSEVAVIGSLCFGFINLLAFYFFEKRLMTDSEQSLNKENGLL
ncbi:hypothetical protein N781_04165 [Pontibacillus halophilus JSM 076056 = DSM 19796]|uniref:Uncharacterized protein n=1 Tax=Pontibacillus halophilus JSM 076056 = DSM 19796 TaxID=1385510 RepID=A0A0A5GJJ7_9BACI|nr:hypothetical protein [Pontibacillus halophilus]KGX91388.1 hypothetical protein N781_04165 [Pontibacillus halophilus JSM 076056 = DSM 19796]